jgi:hypothetical protein
LPLPQSEIDDIQAVEAEDMQLLETLLDEFEAEWKHRRKHESLLEFIKGFFTNRMDEVLTAKNTPRPDELGRIQELGVVLYPLRPEEPPETPLECPPNYGTREWFQCAHRRILDGTYQPIDPILVNERGMGLFFLYS